MGRDIADRILRGLRGGSSLLFPPNLPEQADAASHAPTDGDSGRMRRALSSKPSTLSSDPSTKSTEPSTASSDPLKLSAPGSGSASEWVNAALILIFQEEYRALRPRAPMPPIHIRFRRFTSLNTTIRLRAGEVSVSLSDLLEGAPKVVLHSIAHILLAKLYKKPIDATQNLRYKRFSTSAAVTRQTEIIRYSRGSKRYFGPEGHFYHLEKIFDSLNEQFFNGLLGRPQLTWSEHTSKRSLGHYDAAHNTIVVSRIFDRPSSPGYAIEYLLYHEMLHLKHPVKMHGTRRCVHSREFKAEERLFPQLDAAQAFLKRL